MSLAEVSRATMLSCYDTVVSRRSMGAVEVECSAVSPRPPRRLKSLSRTRSRTQLATGNGRLAPAPAELTGSLAALPTEVRNDWFAARGAVVAGDARKGASRRSGSLTFPLPCSTAAGSRFGRSGRARAGGSGLYLQARERLSWQLREGFWAASGVVPRVALALLCSQPRGGALRGQFQRDTCLRLLAFVRRCATAQRHGGAIALGAYHTAAMLRADGSNAPPRLMAFGRGFHGQLGRGGYDDAAEPAAVEAFAAAGDISDVHCGGSHCAVLCRDGRLFTWGLASSGELGHGGWTPIEVDTPRCVAAFVGKVHVRAVVTGANHTLAIADSGGLWACGRGRGGQLGQGHFNDAGPMQQVEGLRGEHVVAAAAGAAHSLALTACGGVWSWGDARAGQLGQGAAVAAHAAHGWDAGVPLPAPVPLPAWCTADPVVALAAGGHHTLLRTASGRLLACGRGRHGAMGLGDTADRHSLVEVTVDCGAGALRGPNRCICRLGSCASSRVAAMVAGRDHTLVLTACGAVLAAGCNSYGCLGTGDTVGQTNFVRVASLPRITGIAAGESHSAAVAADGQLFLWGRGDWGQLGSSDYRSHWHPVPLRGHSLAVA